MDRLSATKPFGVKRNDKSPSRIADAEVAKVVRQLSAVKIVCSFARRQTADDRALATIQHWRTIQEPRFAKLRAQLFPRRSVQPAHLSALLAGFRCAEVISPLEWIIHTLARRRSSKSRRKVMVPVQRVFSHIWHPARIARIFDGLHKGTQPPPVSVSRIWFRGVDFYVVDDGNHRTEVVRMTRGEKISARIIEECHFVPGDWWITRTGLKHRSSGERRAAAADYRAAARWLGILRIT
jgi:hypothetical protein